MIKERKRGKKKGEKMNKRKIWKEGKTMGNREKKMMKGKQIRIIIRGKADGKEENMEKRRKKKENK